MTPKNMARVMFTTRSSAPSCLPAHPVALAQFAGILWIDEKVRCPMSVCGVSDSCSGSTGNETCDTATGRPQWVLLFVHANHERKVAEGLQAKGYEAFLPMHTVRRQWSDRGKTYDAPLFPGQLFCRFSSILVAKRILAVTTPGVVLAKPMPIPQTGEIVEVPGCITIRG